LRKGRTPIQRRRRQLRCAEEICPISPSGARGQLDPVIGRDEEIRRTIQVLSRRTKNNPC